MIVRSACPAAVDATRLSARATGLHSKATGRIFTPNEHSGCHPCQPYKLLSVFPGSGRSSAVQQLRLVVLCRLELALQNDPKIARRGPANTIGETLPVGLPPLASRVDHAPHDRQ
jgi:hypothetical protein